MASARITALLGTELQGKTGPVAVDAALAGKTIGLYFSAHWCPPCRGFTPMLAEWYKQVKESRSDFEVVFLSSDRDQSSFDEYFAEMPWLALPYTQRAVKEAASKKFKVQGIPTLVFLSPEGRILTKDGRAKIQAQARKIEVDGFKPTPEAFSWAEWQPKTFWQILEGAEIKDNKGAVTPVAALQQLDAVGLYFSAHWCPPCRGFTPKLAEVYNKYRARGLSFDIVFVTSDKTQAQYDEYFHEMPWKALAFPDGRKDELEQLYQIDGIPALIIVGKDGKVITANGRAAVSNDPEGNDFPWHPKPLNEVNETCVDYINSEPVFILFPAGGQTDPLVGELLSIAEGAAAAATARAAQRGPDDDDEDEDGAVHFLWSGEHPIASRIVDVCKINLAHKPTFALLDLSNGTVYDAPEGAVTGAAMRDFLAKFEAKQLTGRKLQH